MCRCAVGKSLTVKNKRTCPVRQIARRDGSAKDDVLTNLANLGDVVDSSRGGRADRPDDEEWYLEREEDRGQIVRGYMEGQGPTHQTSGTILLHGFTKRLPTKRVLVVPRDVYSSEGVSHDQGSLNR